MKGMTYYCYTKTPTFHPSANKDIVLRFAAAKLSQDIKRQSMDQKDFLMTKPTSVWEELGM